MHRLLGLSFTLLSGVICAQDDAIIEARELERRGEQHFRQSDIGEAQRFWTDALRIRQVAFGDSSCEAAVGYAYQARYHDFMVGAVRGQQVLALQEAARGKRLSANCRGSILPAERVVILREYAYAYKLNGEYGLAPDSARARDARMHFAQALLAATEARDTIGMARIQHDIGNTFTDEAIRYSSSFTLRRIRPYVDSALARYNNSTRMMVRAGMPLSEEVMMDQLTTGLLYSSVYGADSSNRAINAYDEALRIMLTSCGHAIDVNPMLFEPRISNKAQMVELLYLRALACAPPFQAHHGVERFRAALISLEAAVPYWEAMMREYKSRDYYKVIGSYSHFPFRYGTWLAAELSRLEQSPERMAQALEWFDRNRVGMEQRERLRMGVEQRGRTRASTLQVRPQQGTSLVAFHDFQMRTAFVLDANGARVARFEMESLRMLAQELGAAMRDDDPPRFQRAAFELYTNLIGSLSIEDRRLVIIPSYDLASLPFEALVTDTIPRATWGSLKYLVRDHDVRYARTIAEAAAPTKELNAGAVMAGVSIAPGTSDMPFSRALANRLVSVNGGSRMVDDLNRAQFIEMRHQPTRLHLVAHAQAPTAPDGLPYIALMDGPLQLSDLDSTITHVCMAVLSTCSSGAGHSFIGEGTIGLGQALLRNGVGTVVQTLWPVDDRATSEVLDGFYRAMNDGRPASEALTSAKRAYLDAHMEDGLANPMYWSGVVLHGRDARLPAQGNAWWWALGTATAGIAGYSLAMRSRRCRALGAN